MNTVTIPKKEYQQLLDKALKYQYLRNLMNEDVFSPPPVRSVSKILREFRTAKRYGGQFLASLKKGLGRSSYFQK